MIEYRKGDALIDSNTNRVICHIVNNKGGFGKGFALQVRKKLPIVKDKYKEWYHLSFLNNDHNFKLGAIQKIDIDETLSFINMLCQNGYKNNTNTLPLDYNALEMCLEQIKDIYPDREIWMPKIGTGYGGGDWNIIESLIENCLFKRKVVIYEI